MKKNLFPLLLLLLTITTSAYSQGYYNAPKQSYNQTKSSGYVNPNSTYNSGYIKSNGTSVQSHYKTQSNQTNHDNYSTRDNVNPYTSERGTKAKDYSNDAYNYGAGQVIQTGSKGGQYYINSNGNKTYVPKR